ncbi:tripartite tricarboxylate transporter TctB family protein [Paracoccus tegillarcae]|uniref:tripartite tricarboxylate transporter TctB family protein n=1 Tax=Paracoccus tegillarcae TaxID=1529068 RepID=UPI001E469FE6|nr:tripartite tricarboxylate transporter TctB family protein [Paracoccus tegillarcae]
MSRVQTLQELFKRYRRPGDKVFAFAFFMLSLFLLTQLPHETEWVEKRTNWYAQPMLWSSIGVLGMVFFGFLHLVSTWISPKIPGRWKEVGFWLQSLEFVVYFLIYVAIVPQLGYLPSTLFFCLFLAVRTGFRTANMLLYAAVFACVTAIFFRGFLQVKIPAGAIYDYLPEPLRGIALIYL